MKPSIRVSKSLTIRRLVFLCLLLSFFGCLGKTADAAAEKWAYIQVFIEPEEAADSARWYIEANKLQSSGDTVKVNAQKNVYYNINFTDIEGYETPGRIELAVDVRDEPYVMTGTYTSLTGEDHVEVNDLTLWPLWPQKKANYNVWEPTSFTSVGRDVVSWVVFESLDEDPTFWLSDLKIMVKKDETSYTKVTPDFNEAEQITGYIVGQDIFDFPDVLNDLEGSFIQEHLRTYSVIPSYSPGINEANWWMRYEPEPVVSPDVYEYYPNQDFDSSWFSYNDWKYFLVTGLGAGKELQDSGHAPPLTMWAVDNWLYNYVDKNSVPGAWINPDGTEKVFIFLPTNQGMLNCFEVDDSPLNPSAKRIWSIMPFPAFQQAVYSRVRYENDKKYTRMTILDGPVYVHDAQDSSGEWRRILVGSTGLGTEQVNKVAANWNVEKSPLPTGSPKITGKSRIFGIYAIDVTDPFDPEPLWSVTNIDCPREQGASVRRVDIQNAQGGNINTEDYWNVEFMTSKPQIGFTETPEGQRVWHLLMVTIDKDGKYLWINADPMTGEVMSKGSFNGFDGQTPEELPPEDYELFNYEDWYPSRILSAYSLERGLPVLSDVYVFLSNGTFYSWNLNGYSWTRNGSNLNSPEPEKIFNLYTNEGHQYPAPPITDFDIAYIHGDTYLAATAPVSYPGEGQTHDTYGLLVVNLSLIKDKEIQDLNMQGSQGQDGDEKFRVVDEGVVMVQLQSGPGGNAYDFEDVVAAPLFIGGTVYQALYSTEGEVSRLYTLDLDWISKITKKSGQEWLSEGGKQAVEEAYMEHEGRFAGMAIDAAGNLILLDESGQVLVSIPVFDPGAFGNGGHTETENLGFVYWKTK